MRRVGVVMGYAEDDPETKARLAAFWLGLQKRGWATKSNFLIDYHFVTGNSAQLQLIAKQLVDLGSDVILAHTTPVAAAVRRESSTIPIVFVNVSDPIGAGFIASLSKPGG